MKPDELLKILNTGSRELLVTFPGIGPALADRIISSRPFDSLQAVQSVNGISQNILDKISAAVNASEDAPPEEIHEEDLEGKVEGSEESASSPSASARERLSKLGEEILDRTQSAREAVKEGFSNVSETVKDGTQSVSDLPEKIKQVTTSRGLLWTVLVSSGITILLSTIFILLLFASINGSLKYATSSDYRSLQRESTLLTTKIDTLQTDIDGLRERVNTLEGLGDRMVGLEKDQKQLNSSMDVLSGQMDALQTEISDLNEKISIQEERTNRFETFLKNLQSMLGSLFMPQGESK